MNPRERTLAMIVAGVIFVAGGFFLFQLMFWQPLQEKEALIRSYQDEIDGNNAKIKQAQLDQARLDRLRLLSLPPNVDVAMREYSNFLTDLLIRSGFNSSGIAVHPLKPDAKLLSSKAKPNFIPLDFNVDCPGKLDNLVRMMEGFYHTGLLHEIKNVSVKPSQVGMAKPQDDLAITMRIEALIVAGAEPRKYLLPNVSPRVLAAEVALGLTGGPTGLGWAGWAAGPSGPLGPTQLATLPRRYAAIGEKNIFVGPIDVKKEDSINVTKFVYLTDISRDEKYLEGHLYNRWDNVQTHLRKAPGLDFFRIRDNNGKVLVSGKVVEMDEREIVFEADSKFYRLHVGESIEHAMKESVPHEAADAKVKEGEKITVKQ